jgi:CSLREA domain-containing protein
MAASSRAADLAVNSTSDAVDANPGDGTCETAPGGGVCTLRAAIQEANALAGDDTINLPAGTYTLSIPPGAEGTVAQDAAVGDLDITDNLTIAGAGAATTIIDGAASSRVFQVALSKTVTMSGLTVRNGADAGGAGIFALGNLTLNDVVVTANAAMGAGGAGIRGGGSLTLNGCTVSANVGTDQGGAIFGGSPVIIDRSTIRGNMTPDQGGGIFSDGPLTITNSTIADNMSTGDQGGGIFIENGDLTVVNCTISGNTATDGGGGIFNNPPIGTANAVRIINATITANTGSGGGGISTFDPGVITLRNALVAGNSSASAPDLSGMVNSEGYNLIGSIDGATIAGDTTGNLVGQPANLGPLADNGGPTLTHGLLPGSAAIDAGDPAGCTDAGGSPLTTDQRGAPRPQGPACDVGAFEGVLSATTTTTTTLPAGSCESVPPGPTFASLDCRLADLIAEVAGESDLGALQAKLGDQLQKAKTHKEKAEVLCRQASKRRTRKALRPAISKLRQFLRTLKSRKARSIPQPVKDALRSAAGAIGLDMKALQRAVQCPQDAPPA